MTDYELPPRLHGESGRDLAALRDYLVRLVTALPEQAEGDGQTAAVLTPAAVSRTPDPELSASALRSLIVKSADRQAADKAELIEAIDSIEGTTLLHIDSSRGTVFKHSQVSTRLTVVLYRGGERITDAAAMRAIFGPGAYLQWWWQRLGEESFRLISADDSRLSDEGFTFTLSPEDVDTKVTFRCELVLAEG